MKIYFIGQKGIPALSGGVERHAEELAIRLVQEGHEVFVYCRKYYNPENLTRYKGINLVTLPTVRTKHLDAIVHTFFSTLHAMRQNADVIHYHSIGPASLLWIPKLFQKRAKIVFTFHCADYYHKKWGWFARKFLKLGEKIGCTFADRIITVSKTLKNYIWNAYQIDAHYIPNGSPKPYFCESTDAIESFGLRKDNYILTVSRLVRHKGIHHLISAFKRLRTTKKLAIVGDSAFTDDYIAELRAVAGNDPNIVFTGRQTGQALAELFSHASIFVHPSESEGLSIALLEALRYGIPTVSSDIPENMEVAEDIAMIFQNKNVEDLAAKITYLLQHPDEALEMAKKAQNQVMKEYAWSKVVKDTIHAYHGDIYRKNLKPAVYTSSVSLRR